MPYQIYDYWPFGEPVGMFDGLGGSEAPDLSPCPNPTEPPGDHVFCDNFESGNTLSWTCTSGSGVCTAPPGHLFEALFTGKKLDSETGLFYFEARHLDSRIGRFASPDQGPLVFENPQTFNRYAYAANSPYKYDDPDGKVLDTILDVGFIAYDLFDIGRSLVRGESVSGAQWGALGADVVGAVVPFATGGGALVRAAAHADDIADMARSAGHVSDTAPNLARGAADNAADAVAASGRPPNRIYSARELVRRAEFGDSFHNFPESFNDSIFKGNRRVISEDYVLYTQRGNINGVEGTFEIGVQPSATGRTEVITHRFFRPDP